VARKRGRHRIKESKPPKKGGTFPTYNRVADVGRARGRGWSGSVSQNGTVKEESGGRTGDHAKNAGRKMDAQSSNPSEQGMKEEGDKR